MPNLRWTQHFPRPPGFTLVNGARRHEAARAGMAILGWL
jgi:hypothetical protein